MHSESDWLSRRLILIMGKGGVGKSALAGAAARHLASQGKRVFLAHIQELEAADGAKGPQQRGPGLWEQTLETDACFREYIGLKLKVKGLAAMFLGSHLIQYLQKVSPGIREIVLLGKVWHERQNYDHVIVDMPSTGYALAMVNAPLNFARLFPGGPVHQDTLDMTRTLGDAANTALVNVTLPEEMPLQESVELAQELQRLVPSNKSWLVVNKRLAPDPTLKDAWAQHGKELQAKHGANPLVRAARFRVHRTEVQSEALSKLNRNLFADCQIIDDRGALPSTGLPAEALNA
jgi:anion-transporting  ArsA/GET3 family ATPase